MFCPKCKTEYRDGSSVCTDCSSLLVDKLPESGQNNQSAESFVSILETRNQGDVAFIKSIFDAEEIRYSFWGEVMMNSPFTMGGNFATLLVYKEDLAKAVDLLKEAKILK